MTVDQPFQWKGEGWVRFEDAVLAVLMELEISPGVAQRRLREQCTSGDIRSIRYGVILNDREVLQVFEDPQPINPRQWTQDHLDFTADDPDDESKAVSTFIALSEADLWHWIAGVVETEGGVVVLPEIDERKVTIDVPVKRALRKVPRIKAWLAKEYPDRVPEPGLCPRTTLKADLLSRNKSLEPLDEATLKTAIDEYNRSIRDDPKRS
jgi:hypothetical protein